MEARPPGRWRLQERLALRAGGFFVHKKANGAIAFVNRFGPMRCEREAKAIQGQMPVTAAADAPRAYPLAGTAGWRRAEFARAAKIAIAGLKVVRL